ncbi:hypothetical protein J32TS6_18930 [Virgibacillus pantothenticus]|uniref:hypothetical protein n=1 Tax=Virgibacillus pantothenticus TaxID=1473 RepID=UPI001AFF3A67|nr:hypothetical protein [Virgibacillus pantothenticus]GIP63338.1 hypothetical protein J32TS6_18930 [Virgibacillus pantothenticus]
MERIDILAKITDLEYRLENDELTDQERMDIDKEITRLGTQLNLNKDAQKALKILNKRVWMTYSDIEILQDLGVGKLKIMSHIGIAQDHSTDIDLSNAKSFYKTFYAKNKRLENYHKRFGRVFNPELYD